MWRGWKYGGLLVLLFIITSCQNKDEAARYEVIFSKDTEIQASVRPTNEKYTIGMVPKATENPYFNQVEDGAREAAMDLGVELIYEGSPVADTEQQIRVIRNLIARNVDMLAISANDSTRLLPVLMEAKRHDIRVITWDSDTAESGRELFIDMVDPETLGRHLMDALAEQMEEEGTFVILTATSTASNTNEWVKWITAQNREYYPQMTLLQTVATDDDPQKAYSAVMELLAQHPGLGGIIGTSAVVPPAAAKALIDSNVTGLHIAGLSTPNLMRSYLEAGTVQNITLWSPKKLGYLTVVLAKNLLDGAPPYHGQDIRNVGEIRVKGDTVIMGEPLDFTKENVDQYAF